MRRESRSRLRSAVRRVRGLLGPRAVILMYHRIAEEPCDPYGLCVSPACFEQHLEVIHAIGTPMPLSRLAASVRTGALPRGAVCVTFDDGYQDNLVMAAPLLARFDVPATCFITTGAMGREREFWWDEIERVLLHTPVLPTTLRLEVGDSTFEASLAGDVDEDSAENTRRWTFADPVAPTPRHDALRALHTALRPFAETERERVLGRLREWAGVSARVRPTHRALEPEEVARLETAAPIEVGAHTVSHPLLPAQPPDVQRAEIAGSRRTLEEWLGHPVSGFAYPYGEFDETAVAAVDDAGFDHACSGLWGGVRTDSVRLLLPRVEAPARDGAAFEAFLRKYLRQ